MLVNVRSSPPSPPVVKGLQNKIGWYSRTDKIVCDVSWRWIRTLRERPRKLSVSIRRQTCSVRTDRPQEIDLGVYQSKISGYGRLSLTLTSMPMVRFCSYQCSWKVPMRNLDIMEMSLRGTYAWIAHVHHTEIRLRSLCGILYVT